MASKKKVPGSQETGCARCERGTPRTTRRASTHRTPEGVEIIYGQELTVCDNCGDEFQSYDQAIASSKALTAAIAREERAPEPEQIVRVRDSYRLSQAQFEQALGVGPKTVIRWEKGTVPPSGAASSLLWVAEHCPDAFRELAKRNGVEIAPALASAVATDRSMVFLLHGTRQQEWVTRLESPYIPNRFTSRQCDDVSLSFDLQSAAL